MGFWDICYFGWFALMGLSVVGVFGAAIYDSMAAKKRLRRASAPAPTNRLNSEEPIQAEPIQAEAIQAEAVVEATEVPDLEELPASDIGFEELRDEGAN